MRSSDAPPLGPPRPAPPDAQSIPGDVEHVVKTIDVQPSVSSNAILVFVTGDVKVRPSLAQVRSPLTAPIRPALAQIGGPNPMKFTQFFQLVATGPTSFYVHNDIMRLVYA